MYLNFFRFKNFALLYILGEEPEPTEPHQIFYPEPELHKNDAPPQHCLRVLKSHTGVSRLWLWIKKIDSALGEWKMAQLFTQIIYQNLAQSDLSSEEGSKAYFCKKRMKHSEKTFVAI
jgi:hypothetical protein